MKKYFDTIFILILTVIILWVQFFTKSWTYFLLDWVFYPIYEFQWFFETSLFWHLNTFFTIVFWYILYSKIFLFWTVFFTGIFWLKLSELFLEYFKIDQKNKKIISYSTILFFLLNPFFYERMITQPGISLWFLFIWFWFYFLLKNIANKNEIKNFIFSWILFWIAFSVMNHSLFIVSLIYILYIIFYVRNKDQFLWFILSWFLFIIINANWLIWNFFLNTWVTLNYVNSINSANVANFTTHSLSHLWEEITTLLLYGFWWEKWNHFLLPDKINEKWYISWFIILFIILFWFIKWFLNKKYKKISLFLFLMWFLSYILWVWIVAQWWFISQFLYDYIPFYNWLREPQKWIWLLVIIYGVFFMYWLSHLSSFIEKKLNFKYNNLVILFIVFLFLHWWNPNTLFWFNHQLFMSDFPKEYFEVKENELKNNYKENKYLVLPWHSYMSCDYTKWKIVANVIWWILKPLYTITSDNIEVWNLYTNSSNIESKDIESFLSNKDINLLKNHQITHIIMLETCADFKTYKDKLNELEKKSKIKKIFRWTKISIYKIQ